MRLGGDMGAHLTHRPGGCWRSGVRRTPCSCQACSGDGGGFEVRRGFDGVPRAVHAGGADDYLNCACAPGTYCVHPRC